MADFHVMTALCIAVVFVVTRRYPETPVLLAVSLGTLSTGVIGFLGTDLQEMMAGSLWVVLVMCLLVMPLAWCLLSLAPRYTAPTNVSLLMLLEMVLGPFWVWLGTGERPSPMMLVGAAIVLVTLASYIIATARAEVGSGIGRKADARRTLLPGAVFPHDRGKARRVEKICKPVVEMWPGLRVKPVGIGNAELANKGQAGKIEKPRMRPRQRRLPGQQLFETSKGGGTTAASAASSDRSGWHIYSGQDAS